MVGPLLPLEQVAIESGCPGSKYGLTPQDTEALVRSPYYRPSLGSPPSATHYRRSLPDGSCLHLVVRGGVGELHCDRFDPHRDPMSFAFHLCMEAPREAAQAIDMALVILRLIGR